MTQAKDVTTNRNYKDTMFKMIFGDKKNLLQLYNAVSGRNYDNPDLLEVNTLENAIYMGVKNDLSFIIDSRLSLYGHQSTYNPNLPLRFLVYVSDLYAGVVKNSNIYGSKQIPLPAPRFVVFYNGEDEQPEYWRHCLSDSYITNEEEILLELIVDVYNINIGHNQQLLDACQMLKEYSEYVYRVRKYAKEMSIERAVDKTVDECIEDGILKEFLLKNKAEAKAMCIYEYNFEEHMRMEREETERERERADSEKERADKAEAEIARLREEIKRLRGKKS